MTSSQLPSAQEIYDYVADSGIIMPEDLAAYFKLPAALSLDLLNAVGAQSSEDGFFALPGDSGDPDRAADAFTRKYGPDITADHSLTSSRVAAILLRKDEAPQDEVPVDEAPQDEAPQDEVPVDEAPQDEVPVDEVPVDEVPVDEVPVEMIETWERMEDLLRASDEKIAVLEAQVVILTRERDDARAAAKMLMRSRSEDPDPTSTEDPMVALERRVAALEKRLSGTSTGRKLAPPRVHPANSEEAIPAPAKAKKTSVLHRLESQALIKKGDGLRLKSKKHSHGEVTYAGDGKVWVAESQEHMSLSKWGKQATGWKTFPTTVSVIHEPSGKVLKDLAS